MVHMTALNAGTIPPEVVKRTGWTNPILTLHLLTLNSLALTQSVGYRFRRITIAADISTRKIVMLTSGASPIPRPILNFTSQRKLTVQPPEIPVLSITDYLSPHTHGLDFR